MNENGSETVVAESSDIDSAVFTGNAHIDNLMSVVIALGAEIWAGQQRTHIIESLLETKGKVTNNGDGTFTYDPNGAFESLRPGQSANCPCPRPRASGSRQPPSPANLRTSASIASA